MAYYTEPRFYAEVGTWVVEWVGYPESRTVEEYSFTEKHDAWQFYTENKDNA